MKKILLVFLVGLLVLPCVMSESSLTAVAATTDSDFDLTGWRFDWQPWLPPQVITEEQLRLQAPYEAVLRQNLTVPLRIWPVAEITMYDTPAEKARYEELKRAFLWQMETFWRIKVVFLATHEVVYATSGFNFWRLDELCEEAMMTGGYATAEGMQAIDEMYNRIFVNKDKKGVTGI